MGLTNQKAASAKLNVCLCMEAIIVKNESRINQIRDFDKIVILLGNYMLDSAVEVRNASKQAMGIMLGSVFNRSEVEKILQRQFSEANYNRLNTIFSKELSQANTSLMITNYQSNFKYKIFSNYNQSQNRQRIGRCRPNLKRQQAKFHLMMKKTRTTINQ